ncbi:hypothetical protein BpHYR1_026370 [Brachionus plicatilis]|uniref:Uncharacterized protein n=1 Tax=Brachionus plicatilis TaxID=10195 RepID=A0A3M7SDU7_BRAPC|nr:hypothetical protein BpHYR1_026370 [Brachionus plicatilis]
MSPLPLQKPVYVVMRFSLSHLALKVQSTPQISTATRSDSSLPKKSPRIVVTKKRNFCDTIFATFSISINDAYLYSSF